VIAHHDLVPRRSTAAGSGAPSSLLQHLMLDQQPLGNDRRLRFTISFKSPFLTNIGAKLWKDSIGPVLATLHRALVPQHL